MSGARQASSAWVARRAASSARSVVPAATATEKTTSSSTGSTSGPSVISREAPMPPKAPPASSAPSAVRKRPRASNPIRKMASPKGGAVSAAGSARTGTIAAALTVAASTIGGIAR